MLIIGNPFRIFVLLMIKSCIMKISKSLSKKVNPETGLSEIHLRVILGKINGDAKTLRAKSGIFVLPEMWVQSKESLREIKTARVVYKDKKDEAEQKNKDAARQQEHLDSLCSKIIQSLQSIPRGEVTRECLDRIIDEYHHPEKYIKKPDQKPVVYLVDMFAGYVNKNELSDLRKRHYDVVSRMLQKYELYFSLRLELDSLTDKTLQDIDRFLRIEHTLVDDAAYISACKAVKDGNAPMKRDSRPKERGQNTISGIFKKIRAVILWSMSEGYTSNNPFNKFHIASEKYGTPIYISIEERNKLYNADLSFRPALAVQRDIFVFQSCIGCRVGDLLRMTRSNLVGNNIEYIPSKTKEDNPAVVSVPLNAVAREIIDRYDGKSGNKLLPFISDIKYNVAIKDAFRLAGLDRLVTIIDTVTEQPIQRPLYEVASSHMARRTFVGNLYKKVKDPNLVGKLSGHKEGSKAFVRYRDIDQEMKEELVKMIE